MRARFLFSDEATSAELNQWFAEGALVKATRLTEAFTYADFRKMHGENALLLFVVSETGKMHVEVAGEPSSPRAGQTIIALVKPAPASAAES